MDLEAPEILEHLRQAIISNGSIALYCCLHAYFLFLSSSVANQVLNAVPAPLSAVLAKHSSSDVTAHCSSSAVVAN